MSGANSTLPSSASDDSPTNADAHPFVQFHGLVNGSWFVFLVISFASSLLGGAVRPLGLPLITGYMLTGVMVGPYLLDMVHDYQIPDLAYVTQSALAYIAFSAGSELYLPELRSLFRPILALTITTGSLCYLVCAFLVWAMSASPLMVWMHEYGSQCRLMISLTMASIMVARSPASAIAVVRELNAHGPLTSCMLGVTVVGDVVVLLLFTLSSSLALAVCSGDGFKGAVFLITILSLGVGVGIGYAFGYLCIFLLWVQRAPGLRFTILPLGLLVFILCDWFELYSNRVFGVAINFDALLICIVAGYVVTNQSQSRMVFMNMLGQFGPYVFIPFFTKVGVELNLHVLWQSIGFAIVLFLVRAVCMWLGGYLGGKAGALSRENCVLVGFTMLSQAGVSLGLASEVSVKFSQSFGPDFQTACVGVIVLNQLIGPPVCKYAIKRAREAGRLGKDGLPVEEGAVSADDPPDLQLSYETDDYFDEDAGGSGGGGFDDSTTPGAAPSTTMAHRRASSGLHPPMNRRGSSGGVGGGGGGSSASSSGVASSSSFGPRSVINIHGARFRKPRRKRALLVGITGQTLSAAQRLLDTSDEWCVVLVDESAAKVARAQLLLASIQERRRAAAATLVTFDPLPSLLRTMSQLAAKTTHGLEVGLDSLLSSQIGTTGGPTSDGERLVDGGSGGGRGSTGDGRERTGSTSAGGDDGLMTSSDGAHASAALGDGDREDLVDISISGSPEPAPTVSAAATAATRGTVRRSRRGGRRTSDGFDELKEEPEDEGDLSLSDEEEEAAAPRRIVASPESLRSSRSPSTAATGGVASASAAAATHPPVSITLPHDSAADGAATNFFSPPPGSSAHPTPHQPHPLSSATPHQVGGGSRIQLHRLATENHRTFLDAYQAIEEDLFLSRDGVDVVLLSLQMDAQTHDLALHLTDRRRFGRVVARVHHPAWGSVLTNMGVIPIFPPAMEAQMVGQILSSHDTGAVTSIQFVNAMTMGASADVGLTSPSHGSSGGGGGGRVGSTFNVSDLVASTIRPDDDLACALEDLDAHERNEFTRLHPPPPSHLLASSSSRRSRAPHFLSVVSEAQRENYMSAILNLHKHQMTGERDEDADDVDPVEAKERRRKKKAQQPAFVGGVGQLRLQQQSTRSDRAASNAAAAASASVHMRSDSTGVEMARQGRPLSPSGNRADDLI